MPKILIIDDDEAFAWSLKEMIEVFGDYRVVIAIGGKSGLKAAKNERPDLILCDYEMPDLLGREVLQKLNAMKKTKDIPVIMVSGLKDNAVIEQAYYEYAEQYIFKPVDPEELKKAIEKVLDYENLKGW
jgi:CheY-like chemotaxis protein